MSLTYLSLNVSQCGTLTPVFSLIMMMVAGLLDDHVLHCDSVTVCILTCIQPAAVPLV
jgi:hypothetical protein